MAAPAIRTESLTKIYQRRRIALNCVDLDVEAGTVLGILGRNGAGKTTLIRLLMGLQTPTAGKVYVLGRQMTPGNGSLRRRIGYLPAEPKFPPRMTPIEFLDYIGRLGGVTSSKRRPRLATLLKTLDLSAAAGDPIRLLSSGLRTRLAIAASLVNDPDVIVWDEPSQGLDPDSRRNVLSLLSSFGEAKTILITSHNLLDLQEVCSHVLVLNEGQVVFNGALEELTGTLKPNEFEIGVSGERKELGEALKAIQEFKELEECKITRNTLWFRIRSDQSRAAVLANVLMTLADRKLELTDLRLNNLQAERALSELLRQEGGRGIARVFRTDAA
ncbi:MAG: ABC transporter ATP-binding protein [Planctomycetia bacterium]